jgi:N-acetylneuraminate synthase/N,N'-diacetyllegionaminate synthase
MASRELSFDELRDLRRDAHERGLIFFATPHDDASLSFLADDLDVPCLKIGSGESNNWHFLRRVGATKKPILIAFGLQDASEARRAVDVLQEAGAPEVVAFHTVSVYPTPYELANLRRIAELRELLDVPIGLSDHTIGWHVPLAAVALGAQAVEKHLTFDRSDPRSLDNPGALEPEGFAHMVAQIRDLEQSLATPPEASTVFEASRDWALQAVVAAHDLQEGDVLGVEHVAFKRPARGGVLAAEVDTLLGKRLVRRVEADEQILPSDVAETQ